MVSLFFKNISWSSFIFTKSKNIKHPSTTITNKLKLRLFACIFLARFRVPWAQQLPRILWRKILDNVEVAHVWMHRLSSSISGDWRGQKGIPRRFPPYYRIWQQASSPVHQFHRLQAPGQLNFNLSALSTHFNYWVLLGSLLYLLLQNFFKLCTYCFSILGSCLLVLIFMSIQSYLLPAIWSHCRYQLTYSPVSQILQPPWTFHFCISYFVLWCLSEHA